MYADHFDILSFHARREELRGFEHRKHQMEVEILKVDLDAARDRILALETAYEELQMAYEEAARSSRTDGTASRHEREEVVHQDANNDPGSSPNAVDEYDVDVDSDEWETPPSPWMGDSPSSSASIPSFIRSISPTPNSSSREILSIATPTFIPTSSSPSSSSVESSYDFEPEVPALINASQENALRYAELLEQCDYDVKAANMVWREWEASERERRSTDPEASQGGQVLIAHSEANEDDTDDENSDSDSDWEPYDFDAYERAGALPSSPSFNLSSSSSQENIRILSPAQTSITTATSDVHCDRILQSRPHPILPPNFSQTHSYPFPGSRNNSATLEPTIYVDASGTGVGFCLCIPTKTITTAGPSPTTNTTCYWLTWNWVRGHPAIPVDVKGHIIMSWAEIIALELGVHVTCAMRSQHAHPHSFIPPFSFLAAQQQHASPVRLMIHSDNMEVVTAFSRTQRTRTHTQRWKHERDVIVRRILDTCEAHEAQLAVRWVPSKANLADGPSRGRGVHAMGWDHIVGGYAGEGEGTGTRADAVEFDARGWMEWVGTGLPVPDHLESFVQAPTGGVVELRRLKSKGAQ